ncbi:MULTISPECIES: hypothetical protein [Vagococcus]|uniref:Uncharacterized protein n=1 Tax=Vagococcus fluvialis bH819 TaxID=1255619 RepID=A0A1X6WMV3_9ENTE|nr:MULTISPECIES: hypothetical protein [Vagococcus]SLM85599.1 hypothetical protein FM121_05825 [Vagococcus fluvialis bH819]
MYDNQIFTQKEVLSVMNAYYLCCYDYANKEDKNSLEKYLIVTKVNSHIKKFILEIEDI